MLELCPLKEDDIELVRSWRNSPAVAQYMYSDNIISEEEQKRWYQRLGQDPTKKYWMIWYNSEKVGVVNLYNINYQFKNCYWAFYLGNTEIRGGGIGARIEYKILEYVFSELKFNKLLCEVLATNNPVIDMHEKFGFRRESYFREHVLKGDKYVDVVGLAILRNEWKKLRELYLYLGK